EHRRAGEASYCLYDFNLSIQLPLDTSLRDCRRPAIESMITQASIQPKDIMLGEHVYNPFAFDVACLGNIFRVHFSRATSIIPLLAPLFDRMTTHILAERFTAEEALVFLDNITAQVSEDASSAPVILKVDWSTCDDSGNYWYYTPPGFIELWSHYRTPQHGWSAHAVDALCTYQAGWSAVCYLRALLRI
ncbi:hypothetical protein BV20DRAFT_958483, partial [Pilatotrama ljubarskyi]